MYRTISPTWLSSLRVMTDCHIYFSIPTSSTWWWELRKCQLANAHMYNEWDLHITGLPPGMNSGTGNPKTKMEWRNFQNYTECKRYRKEIKGSNSMVESEATRWNLLRFGGCFRSTTSLSRQNTYSTCGFPLRKKWILNCKEGEEELEACQWVKSI